MFVVLWSIGNPKESLMSDKIVASIVTSEEDEEFIRQVCEDLGLESEVTMIVGPYYVHSFFSPSLNYRLDRLLSRYPITVDPSDPTRRILINEFTYIESTADERKAAIAHEMWHIYSIIKNRHIPGLNLETDADKLATNYVHADIVIGLLRKYGDSNSIDIQVRIGRLEKQRGAL